MESPSRRSPGLAGHDPQPRPRWAPPSHTGHVHRPGDHGSVNYSKIAFETDLPRIEASDSQDKPPFCDRTTGATCVNPPAGAQFYPIFTTGRRFGGCVWQEGGPYLPGTTNTFGGTSTAEFGPLLKTVYPATGFTTVARYNNSTAGICGTPAP